MVYGPSGVTSMCREKGVNVDPCHLLRVSLGLPFINHHLGCVFECDSGEYGTVSNGRDFPGNMVC